MWDLTDEQVKFIKQHCGRDMTVGEAARHLGIRLGTAQIAAEMLDGCTRRPTGIHTPGPCQIAPGIRARKPIIPAEAWE